MQNNCMEVIMLRRFIVCALVLGSVACTQRIQPGSPEYEQEHSAHNFAIAAHVTEIEEGRLALERSTNMAIRNLAQMLIDDHSSALAEHLDMAGRFGEEWEIEARRPDGAPANGQPAPPVDIDLGSMDREELLESPLSAEITHSHEASMKELAQLAGAEFDRAYLARQVATHRLALERIDAFLPAMISERIRVQLEADRAVVAAHLQMAERLANR
jgi:predicted outer membrane protein